MGCGHVSLGINGVEGDVCRPTTFHRSSNSCPFTERMDWNATVEFRCCIGWQLFIGLVVEDVEEEQETVLELEGITIGDSTRAVYPLTQDGRKFGDIDMCDGYHFNISPI
jgi:hypothetical protein